MTPLPFSATTSSLKNRELSEKPALAMSKDSGRENRRNRLFGVISQAKTNENSTQAPERSQMLVVNHL